MPSVAVNDIDYMRDAVLFDGPDVRNRLSRFAILITLSSTIAAAGVVADSTATVIGAMIVAPLMIPIQGTTLSVVLGDRKNLLRSIGLVVAGAFTAMAIGWLVGSLVVNDVVANNNAQVAARVSPRLIDLLAALATGVVGSVALVRRDISDTLPGVAIAISLVPPLSVVGLTFEAGAWDEAAGALLLFVTNVAAILATGIVVLGIYRVHRMVRPPVDAEHKAVNRRNAVLVIVALFVLVGVPLTASTVSITQQNTREGRVKSAAEAWAAPVGWEVVDVSTRQGEVIVRAEGPLPIPDTATMRYELVKRGVDPTAVQMDLLPRKTVRFGAPKG